MGIGVQSPVRACSRRAEALEGSLSDGVSSEERLPPAAGHETRTGDSGSLGVMWGHRGAWTRSGGEPVGGWRSSQRAGLTNGCWAWLDRPRLQVWRWMIRSAQHSGASFLMLPSLHKQADVTTASCLSFPDFLRAMKCCLHRVEW